MNNNLSKNRLNVFEKLLKSGFDTDDKILKLKIEELLKFQTFSRSDLEIAFGIKEAYQSKKLIAFLSGNDGRSDK